jgi:hypothetical protein
MAIQEHGALYASLVAYRDQIDETRLTVTSP